MFPYIIDRLKRHLFQRDKGELDEEMLTLTGEVLSVNPDFFTLWNIRKETFLEMVKTRLV